MTEPRTLPHNLEAEQALLGSLMFDNAVFERLPDRLRSAHFYEPFHARLYEAISTRIGTGIIAEPTILHDGFAADPAYAEFGGLRYLADLVDKAPPAANAVGYARSILDLATRRDLIRIADQMAAEAVDPEKPANDHVASAENALFTLAESGEQAKAIFTFSDAVDGALAMIEAAYQRDGRLAGLASALVDLDQKLGGLHPSDLLILAGRPSMGKTALATNIGFNIAKEYRWEPDPDAPHGRRTTSGGRVMFASLEMSKEQLAQRILADASGVSSDRMRKGLISRDDFARIREARDLIRSIPLHIDETGGIHIAKLCARVRRQHRREGLDLLIVDYLQLCTTGDGRSQRNRTQEVSEITGALKALAKELGIPILALSQLSRQVESRDDKRPMLSDLRECVIGSTLLTDADTGGRVQIKDLKAGQRVLGVAPSLKVAAGPVADVWSTGVKPVFRVTSKTGRVVVATANHPFLTSRGWVRLEELTDSDRLATAYRLPNHGREMPDRADLCRLLGYLAGNGSYQEHRTLGLIIPDEEAFADASAIITANWPEVSIKVRANGYNDAWISRTFENGHGRPGGNPMREWLRGLGMIGERDTGKHVPEFVFEAGEIGAAEFLAGYLETDGCVTNTADRWSVRFDTTSHRLAQDTAALLVRLGVASTIGSPTMGGLAKNPIYRITVSQSPENLRRFASAVKPRGIRGRRLAAMLQGMTDRATRNSVFVLPSELSAYAASTTGRRDQGKAMSRQAAEILLAANDDEVLRSWAESDFLWDEIRSIEPAGEEETFDVRVPGLNSFLANGVAVHNSGSIEQDADCVMFVYREAYYLGRSEPKPGSDAHLTWTEAMTLAQGQAEVIVGKQRHGPIGTVRLSFDEDTTRFGNLAREAEYEAQGARFSYGGGE